MTRTEAGLVKEGKTYVCVDPTRQNSSVYRVTSVKPATRFNRPNYLVKFEHWAMVGGDWKSRRFQYWEHLSNEVTWFWQDRQGTSDFGPEVPVELLEEAGIPTN